MERRLAAILVADVVGYSRLIRADEEGTIAALKALRADLIDPKISEHHGRIVKLMGDGMLVEFGSVVDAVRAAVETQRALADRNAAQPDERRIEFRVGINLGDVVIDGDDIQGDGVNVAARLEGLAKPGGICISGSVYEQVRDRLDLPLDDLGEQEVKNIARPVRVWRWTADAGLAPSISAKIDEPLSLPDKPSIAVLPFDNMSGDPEQEYFSDGITEDIITELSRFRELLVIARNSSFSYKGKSMKVQAIGQDLGADYIVEGSVRRSGNRLRITVQLVDAASGKHVWAERYDRQLEDIFDLQDEITQSIVRLLPVRLQGDLQERVRRKPSENLTAYDCYLRGRWRLDHAFWQDAKALELLWKAVKIDPNCAHAYAYIALVHAYSVFTFGPLGRDPIAIARDNMERALSSGEGDHFIHAVAGEVYVIAGEHELAMSHSEKSLALNPNDIFALCSRGLIVAYSGEPEVAVELLREAFRYDPMMPEIFRENLAEAFYLMRDYENALVEYKRWQNPSHHTFTHIAACYAQLGRQDEAAAAAQVFEKNSPPDADFASYAKAHARLCKRAEDSEHWLEGYRKAGLMV
jgi:adenylate cyclase